MTGRCASCGAPIVRVTSGSVTLHVLESDARRAGVRRSADGTTFASSALEHTAAACAAALARRAELAVEREAKKADPVAWATRFLGVPAGASPRAVRFRHDLLARQMGDSAALEDLAELDEAMAVLVGDQP